MLIIARKMVLCQVRWWCAFVVLNIIFCDCQFQKPGFRNYEPVPKAVPFPPCRADDIECLRRGLRTFFFLMDSGHYGMKPIDPAIINSVSVAVPENQMSFLLRNLNVTGARWTKLVDRRKLGVSQLIDNGGSAQDPSNKSFANFKMTLVSRVEYWDGAFQDRDCSNSDNSELTNNLNIYTENELALSPSSRNSAIFHSDLHVTGDIIMKAAERHDPFVAYITMDIQGVESNITYAWRGQRGYDNNDYIILGQERIAVRNTRTPTFFLQPDSEEAAIIDQSLQMKPAILDHLSNEITASLMHSMVDNFRLFARSVPVHQFYQLYKK